MSVQSFLEIQARTGSCIHAIFVLRKKKKRGRGQGQLSSPSDGIVCTTFFHRSLRHGRTNTGADMSGRVAHEIKLYGARHTRNGIKGFEAPIYPTG